MPLGILYLSSYIKKYNDINNVDIIDYVAMLKNNKYDNLKMFIKSGIYKVNKIPDIIAISLIFTVSYEFYKLLIRQLRKIWPHAIIIIGGTHATNCYKELLKDRKIDYVIRGEGETTLSEFIKQYPDIGNIKGLYSRHSNKPDELSQFITDLDIIPFPDWGLIDMNLYIREKGRKKNIGKAIELKIASIMTTRGCPYHCTFCSSHTVHGRIVRYRSIKNIIDEIKYLYEKYDVRLIIPEDDLFTIQESRILKLLAEIKKLQIPDFELQFTNALSVNTLNEKIVDALIDAGMKIVYLAVESGSKIVQKDIIKKNVNLEKAAYLINNLRSKGVIVKIYIILGFPGETKEMMCETIEWIKKVGRPDWVSFLAATPLVGSEIYNQFIENGSIKRNNNYLINSVLTKRTFDTPEIRAKELNDLLYDSNIDCNFINNINVIEGKYERAISLFKDIAESYPWHIIAWRSIEKCYFNTYNSNKTLVIRDKINNLIKTDKRAYGMYIKYKDKI